MKINILFLLSIGLLTMMACSKMDDYRKYTNGKEITYSGRVDSLKVFPGKERVKLSWLLVSDPKITKAWVYWDNHLESLEVPIVRSPGVEVVDVIIPGMKEGVHSFEVITFHDDGAASVPANKSGRVYGKNYENTLINRGIKSTENLVNKPFKINWGLNESTSLSVDIIYIKDTGEEQEIKVLPTATSTTLTNVKKPSEVRYRTSFKPDPLSIDIFYSKDDILNVK